MLIDFRVRGREREKHQWVVSSMHADGDQTRNLGMSLTGNRNHDPSVYGTTLQPLDQGAVVSGKVKC